MQYRLIPYLHFMRPLFILLLVASVFFCNGAFAQKVTVSPEILLRDDYSYTLLGKVSDKILLVRNKGFGQSLSIYNEGLGFIQEIPLEFEDRKVNLIGFVTSANDFNCYYSFKDKGVEYIKSVKLSPMGEQYFQDTLNVRENAYISDYYKFNGSKNDRYVVVFNPTDDAGMKLMLYDNQEMELIYDTNLIAKGVSMRKDFRKIVVADDGTVGILFEKYNTTFRKEGHHYRLIEIDREGTAIDKQIPMYGKLTNDVELLVSNDNQFEIVGIFGEKYEDMSNGFFTCSGDSINQTIFPDKMLSDVSLNTKKKVEGLQNYLLNDVIQRKDGGFLFVMEANKEFYRSTNSRNFRGGTYRNSVTDYYNEDIVLLSIDPSGALQWHTVLPKKQFSQDDDGVYSSFFIFKTPSKLHFVYNDEIKNNNTVSEYVVNPAGRFERNSVLSTAYQKLKLRIRNATQVSSSAYLMLSERNNRINIVKIEY